MYLSGTVVHTGSRPVLAGECYKETGDGNTGDNITTSLLSLVSVFTALLVRCVIGTRLNKL